jgi:YHS domain-containing protein
MPIMKKTLLINVSTVIGAALLGLLSQATSFAQTYSIRPARDPAPKCKQNTLTFGYNDTTWRPWPLQPRPEERNSLSVGGHVIPPPPPTIEPPLPHAETAPPAKPPVGSGILPTFPSGSTIGPLGSGGAGGISGGSLNVGPGGVITNPAPGIDIFRPDTGLSPNISGGTGAPGFSPKDSIPPGGILPDTPITPITPPTTTPPAITPPTTTPPAITPPVKSSTTPAKDVPAPKGPGPVPDIKPDSPSAGGRSLSGRGEVATSATTRRYNMPIQADWNSALEPDMAGNPSPTKLRSASFEQVAAAKDNVQRGLLGGFCPVQLRENDRWVNGKPSVQASYQGHLYQFSSEAARKRFEAAPEKYAPVQGGNDVVIAMDENRTAPGSVNHSATWHGHLYLFSTSATLAAFQENPARYGAK